MSLTLFVDESGNTGGDLHEENQPVFVYAGVWLSDEHQVLLEQKVAELRKEYRIQQPMPLLKGKGLVASSRGQKFVRGVLVALRELEIPVSIVVVDKPFVAAGVIIEDCCDYVYNDEFDVSWTHPLPIKEGLARRIYRTVHATLLEAAWLSRRLDAQSVRASYERVFGVLRLSGDMELAEFARRMSKVKYDELVGAIAGARDSMSSDYSPNLTAFTPLIQFCDQQADDFAVAKNTVRVVHDEQVEFEELFTRFFLAWRNSGPVSLPTPNGPIRWPLRNLGSIEFANSETHIGIRLADILASAVRVSVQRVLSDSVDLSNDYAKALRELLCSRSLLGQFPSVIASNDSQVKVWSYLAPQELWKK